MKSVYYAFRGGRFLVEHLPLPVSRAISHFVCWIYYGAFPGKRRLVRRNMERALGREISKGELSAVVRRCYRYYADYWVDIFWLPTLTKGQVLDNFRKMGEENLLEALGFGRGVIVTLPHYGSWEAGAVYLASLAPFWAVAELLRPPELFDMFVQQREHLDIGIIPYDHSTESKQKMEEVLRRGEILALLCDRDLKGKGVPVEFMGEETTLPPGPAALALKTGASIVCVSVRNLEDSGWKGHAMPVIEVPESGDKQEILASTMQKVANDLEVLIREDPSQWHLFQPNWPSDRSS